MAKKKQEQPKLTVSKMKGERERQYTAFLLYCEVGSLTKLMQVWEKIRRGGVGGLSVKFSSRLGKLPSRRTIERWSSKYCWVERAHMKLKEDLKVLRERTKQIRKKRAYEITEIFWSKLQALKKQMQKGEGATVYEVRHLWEMMRTEWGESIGKQEVVNKIDEEEQKPLTEEEKILSNYMSEAMKKFNDYMIEQKGKDEEGNAV